MPLGEAPEIPGLNISKSALSEHCSLSDTGKRAATQFATLAWLDQTHHDSPVKKPSLHVAKASSGKITVGKSVI
ncbi:hypothetical protein [Pandoraea faecigallinarum]|uniref:hypothetical protein n=1 Tax=Pandoraea faecigallinarum TaxID=656179 RepID=UPI000AA45573|nr:hypothetical protein [Pandoraea faecigallinarum]